MRRNEVVVIDYGLGNLLSVARALEFNGASVEVTSKPDKVLAAKRVLLPGVGAFGTAMKALGELKLVSAIQELAKRGTPLLGICLGMQLLLSESEEFGVTEGLGLIPGKVKPIPNRSPSGFPTKIPHIGWNGIFSVDQTDWSQTLLADNLPGDEMYFVHSYMAVTEDITNCIAFCDYEGHHINAVIGRGNITGCQFHPEKSGLLGLKVLSRFLRQ